MSLGARHQPPDAAFPTQVNPTQLKIDGLHAIWYTSACE
jgi:hypothetical protein